MKYSIVVPTYNHCDDLLKPCIDSVLKFSSLADIELIVSANGCTDNTFEYLGSLKESLNYLGLADHMKVIWNNEPLGYAKSTNAGIKVATTNKIVLLNNDVVLLPQTKGDWLHLLEAPFNKNPNCGLSGTLLKYSEVTKRNFIIFFCVMIDRKVFDNVGLLSLDYGTGGHEDTDYCMMAEQAGFELAQEVPMVWSQEAMLHVGTFPLYHKGEGTVHDPRLVSDWNNIFTRNELTLAKKYNPEWYEQHKSIL